MAEEKEHVINPFTNRPIRVGGRTYQLVEESLLQWLDQQCSAGPDHNRPRTYCGNKNPIPAGYARRGTQNECLRKGFKTGLCSVYTKFSQQR